MSLRSVSQAVAVAVLVLFSSAPTASASAELDECVPADLRAGAIDFQTGDDVDLTGLVFGDGPRGVLLVPGMAEKICDWLPLARQFADDDYQVLLFETRREVYEPDKSFRFDLDVVAAAHELRRRGATSIVAGGGGTGATALAVAARDVPGLAGVFLLSPWERTALGGHVLDAAQGLDAVEVQVFVAAAADDFLEVGDGQEWLAEDDARALADAALFGSVRIVPGALQGARLAGDGAPVRDDVVAFVAQTLPPPEFPLWLPVSGVALALLLIPAVMLYRGRKAKRIAYDPGGPQRVELRREQP